MDIEINGKGVFLKLSRRNLEALIAKLDNRTQMTPALIRDTDDGHRFIVIAEENDVHYKGREPGKMKPETEERMVLNRLTYE